jgi:hypothetical protein
LDESGYLDLPGGEVLILAGDICEARSMRRDLHATKVLSDQPQRSFPSSEFFKFECAKYDKVFMVMGNHESYHGRLDKTYDELKKMLPEYVTLLENQVEEYNGVMFMGATLWTDINKGDPLTEWQLRQNMSDYSLITNYYPDKDMYHKLTPSHTHKLHNRTKHYFESVLKENQDNPFVVITHHSPSFMSTHEKYKHYKLMNGGYSSDLSEFILDNPQITYWCHGHHHSTSDFMIGDTRVLCNPRGYLPYEANNGFDVNFTFDM